MKREQIIEALRERARAWVNTIWSGGGLRGDHRDAALDRVAELHFRADYLSTGAGARAFERDPEAWSRLNMTKKEVADLAVSAAEFEARQ